MSTTPSGMFDAYLSGKPKSDVPKTDDGKDENCRACNTVQTQLSDFMSRVQAAQEAKEQAVAASKVNVSGPATSARSESRSSSESDVDTSNSTSSSSIKLPVNANTYFNAPKTTSTSMSAKHHVTWHFVCPPDGVQIGNAGWTTLHSMAAYYPTVPSEEDKSEMKSFLRGFSRFYPCSYCAKDMKKHMHRHPPIVDSRQSISLWMCKFHNHVNRTLNKPMFDCSKVMERWRDGPKDGSCDP
jgi:Erv1 / Alr family